METVMQIPSLGAFSRLAMSAYTDRDDIEAGLGRASNLFLPVCGEKNLVAGVSPVRPVALRLDEAPGAARRAEALTLMGRLNDAWLFTGDVAKWEAFSEVAKSRGRFEDLRSILPMVEDADGSLMGYARTLVHWRRRNRFCGACGAPTRAAQGGRMLECPDGRCANQYFPRTDPAVIVLALRADRCLLGRQAGWPSGLYSAVAGFVEPGESLEEAAAREVMEETGIRVDGITYFASDPWPFPASLMVGFRAAALGGDIRLLDNELEDARWFSRDDIASWLENGDMAPPMARTISFRLLASWFDEDARVPLAELAARRMK